MKLVKLGGVAECYTFECCSMEPQLQYTDIVKVKTQEVRLSARKTVYVHRRFCQCHKQFVNVVPCARS